METYENVPLLSVNVSDVSIFSFKAIFVGLAIKFEMTSQGFLLLVYYQSYQDAPLDLISIQTN